MYILRSCLDWDESEEFDEYFDQIPTKEDVEVFVNNTEMVLSQEDYDKLIGGDSIVLKSRWEGCDKRIAIH